MLQQRASKFRSSILLSRKGKSSRFVGLLGVSVTDGIVGKENFFSLVSGCIPILGGKSSLINGIIGDMQSTSESVVTVHGTAALARQDAFIINATVRDNILFGQEFNAVFYEKVLQSCCLFQDLALLGPAGDMTEIGERGVTLSGGKNLSCHKLSVV